MVFSLLGVGVFGLYALSIGKVKYTARMRQVIFILFAFSLAGMAYNAQPLWDLGQHFSYMGAIRDRGSSLWELCSAGIAPYEHNQSYWLFNFFCYLAVKADNFHLLPFAMVLADYLIFSYITLDWQKKHKVGRAIFLFAILMCFTTMPLIHAMAGIRNANGAALSALAAYLYLEKGKPAAYPLLLMAAAALMHPSTLLALPALALSKRKINWKTIAAIGAAVLAMPVGARVFSVSPIPFLKRIGHLYLVFSSAGQYTNSRRYLYVDLVLIAAYLFLTLLNWKSRQRRAGGLENFLALYLICILGNIGNYDLVIRPMYTVAPLAVPAAYTMFGQKWKMAAWHTAYAKPLLLLALSGLCLWCNWEYMAIFATYF